jgi:hypothetical protein
VCTEVDLQKLHLVRAARNAELFAEFPGGIG